MSGLRIDGFGSQQSVQSISSKSSPPPKVEIIESKDSSISSSVSSPSVKSGIEMESKSSSLLSKQQQKLKMMTSPKDVALHHVKEIISGSLSTSNLSGKSRPEVRDQGKALLSFMSDSDKFRLMGMLQSDRRGLAKELAKVVPSEGLSKREHMKRTTAIVEGLQAGLKDFIATTESDAPMQSLSLDELGFMAKAIETKFGMSSDMVQDLFLQSAIMDAKTGLQTTVKGFMNSHFRLSFAPEMIDEISLPDELPDEIDTSKTEMVKPRWSQLTVKQVEIPDVERDLMGSMRELMKVDSSGFDNDNFKRDLIVLLQSDERNLHKGYTGAKTDAVFSKNLRFIVDTILKGPDSEQRLQDFAKRLTEYGTQVEGSNCGDLLIPMAKTFVSEYAQQLAKDSSASVDSQKESSFQSKLTTRVQDKLKSEIFLNKIYLQVEEAYRSHMELDFVNLYDPDENAEFLMGLDYFYKSEGLLPGKESLGSPYHVEGALEKIEEQRDVFLDFFDHVAVHEMQDTVKEMIKEAIVGMAEGGGKENTDFLMLVAQANGHDGTDMFEDWLTGDSDKFQDELMKGASSVSSYLSTMDISDTVALNVLKQMGLLAGRESSFAPQFIDE